MESYFDRQLNGPPFQENEERKYEFKRLISFEQWPKENPIFPLKLAKAGFVYEGNSDEVLCFKCGVKKSGWIFGDNPLEIHKLINPICEFVLETSVDNISVSLDTETEQSSLIQRINELDLQSEVPSTASVAQSATRHSKRSAASSSSAGVSSETVTVTKKQTNNDQGREGGAASTQTGSISSSNSLVPRSKSAEDLNREPSTSTDLTAQSISRSVANLNIPDSAVAHSATGSNSENPSTGNVTVTENTNKNTCNIIGSKFKSKKAAKTQVENSVSSASNTDRQQRMSQDIPPPSGERLGPLRFERNRLETFSTWPSNACVPAGELAKCGFIYTGSGDRVQCVFCKGILRNWEEGDQPRVEHQKHFPRCPLILGTASGNVPLPIPGSAINVMDMASLGVVTVRPKHPQYAIEAKRLSSFTNWPQNKTQKPAQLANAGFWYAGFNDNVKCFFCDGGLRNWERGDEPWSEHARWFPKCPYVLQLKGQEFINTIQSGGDASSLPILQQVQAQRALLPEEPTNIQRQRSGQRKRVEEREIRARMDRPYVKMVESTGLSRELIMKTLRKRLQETGDDFPSAQAFAEAAYQLADEENNQSQSDEQSENETENEAEPGEDVTNENGSPSNLTGELTEQTANKEEHTTDELVEEESTKKKSESLQEPEELAKENQELRQQRLCKICLDNEANVVFLPCGHLVSCAACCPALSCCPICREDIKGTVRTYMA